MDQPNSKRKRKIDTSDSAALGQRRSKRRVTRGAVSRNIVEVPPNDSHTSLTEAAPNAVPGECEEITKDAQETPDGRDNCPCFAAARRGDLNSLRRLRQARPPCPWEALNCALAALCDGHLQVADWIYEQDESVLEGVCLLAAKWGRLDLLQWARARDPAPHWDEERCRQVVITAFQTGRPEVARWGVLQNPAMECTRTCLTAAVTGDLVTLQWLTSRTPPCPWNGVDCALGALEFGKLDIVKWVREHDPSVERSVCTIAAGQGRVDLLKLARAQEPPFRWSINTCATAAIHGELETLQWLRRQEPPCPWLPSDCAELAVARGHFEVLKWVAGQAPATRHNVCWSAARAGRLDILQWARAQKPAYDWGESTTQAAAGWGHLEILQWLRKQSPPCPWDVAACAVEAAYGGHLQTVRWLKAKHSLAATALTRNRLEECVEAATFTGASDEDVIGFLKAEPRIKMGREYHAEVVREDRVEIFRFLAARGGYRYILRPGLEAGPFCARLARQLMIPLDGKSHKRASEVFKRQVALSCGLRKWGVSGDVAQKIGVLAGLPWI